MRRSASLVIIVVVLLFTGALVAQQRVPPRATAYATAPEIPFESVPNFLKLPTDLYLGEVMGVATNSKGHVYVYSRIQDTRLFEFDQDGKFIREIGEGLYGFAFAHTVRVDKDDNVWAVDEGTNMVIKFNPEGKVLMVLGRRAEAVEGIEETPPAGAPRPPHQPYRFSRPTDITWDPAGNIFVSDGYGNSRVVKYDKNGRFVAETGSRGGQPGQLSTPHGISSDANGNIYVADRGNRRIQVFSSDLVLRAIYDHVGAPWTVCVSPGPHQYLYSSNSNPDNNNSLLAAVSGEIYKMELDGKVVGKFGKPGKRLGEFSTVHSIDCRNPDQLFVAEITAWRLQKLLLRSPMTTSAR